MRKFYLNRQFFDFYLGCYYPLFDNIFLHVISCKIVSKSYKKYNQYDCEFCVHPKDSVKDDYFVSVFRCKVNVCNRKILLFDLDYLLNCNINKTPVYLLKYFPLSPAWLLPCSNYLRWLNRCVLSLRVYQDSGWI